MRRNRYFARGWRASQDPAEFVNELHDALDTVVDRALDLTLAVAGRLPWTAEEITRHVDAFVSRHVPDAERCVERGWDDSR
jgi:hypothetical protein